MRLHISHDSNAVYVADRRVIAWDRIGKCQVLIGEVNFSPKIAFSTTVKNHRESALLRWWDRLLGLARRDKLCT
jgi:hypothetical protein